MPEAEGAQSNEGLGEEHFRKMFEGHGAVMLLVCPKTGMVIDANPAAQRFYGLGREELKARTVYDLNTLEPEQVRRELAAAAAAA